MFWAKFWIFFPHKEEVLKVFRAHYFHFFKTTFVQVHYKYVFSERFSNENAVDADFNFALFEFM
jgi:hypothetical protein